MEEQDAVKQRKIVRSPIEKALKLVLKTMSNLKVALLPPQFARDNPLEDTKKVFNECCAILNQDVSLNFWMLRIIVPTRTWSSNP
jgi:hypothetical protein